MKKILKKNSCRFSEKNYEFHKIRDQCQLTDKYRSPAHSNCNIDATQDQSNIIPFIIHNYSNYDCHLFFKKLVDKKKDKVKFKIFLKQVKNIFQSVKVVLDL